MTSIRKKAPRAYTSTMVDCDHMTGLKAKARLPATPPAQQSISSRGPWRLCSVVRVSRSMSEADRVISIAVQPAARAPKTADAMAMLQAGVGCPRKVTKLKTRAKSQAIIVQMG